MLARAPGGGRGGVRLRRRRRRPGGAARRGRAGGGRAGRVRHGRGASARRRGDAGGRLARAGGAGAPPAGRRHRRDRARLLLRSLAARGRSRPPTGASSALARAAGLAVVSHVRDAHADAAAILRDEKAGDGVIHCFSGGVAEARAYLDLGQHLSFSGILTFKNAGDVREAAAFAPLDRILIETDAPYLAPIPHRGRKNEPAYIAETLAALAALRGLPAAEVDAATSANTRRLFRLAVAASGSSGYSIALRELNRAGPHPTSLRVVRRLHRQVRAQRHARRRLPGQPHAAARSARRSRSRSSSRAARSRWRATARSPGSRRSIRRRRRSRTAWACSSCASTIRRASC